MMLRHGTGIGDKNEYRQKKREQRSRNTNNREIYGLHVQILRDNKVTIVQLQHWGAREEARRGGGGQGKMRERPCSQNIQQMQYTKERIIHKEVVCSLADDMSVMEEMTSKDAIQNRSLGQD